MPEITLGYGVANTAGTRVTVDTLAEFIDTLNRHIGLDAWWSPHTWERDRRDKGSRWHGCQFCVLDIDFSDEDGKHKEWPATFGDAIAEILAGSKFGGSFWHLTPRGARLGWLLAAPITDPGIYRELIERLATHANQILAEEGLATHEGGSDDPDSTRPGFWADEACFDTMRFLFTPCCTRDGKIRDHPAKELRIEPYTQAELDSTGRMIAAEEAHTVDVEKILAGLPKTGKGGDGSSALMAVCARACKLGIEKESDFLSAVGRWNTQAGSEAWTEAELVTRFRDALRRYKTSGRVTGLPTPKNGGGTIYKPHVVEKVLAEDLNYRGKLSWNEQTLEVYYNGIPLTDHTTTWLWNRIEEAYFFTPSLPRNALEWQIGMAAMRTPFNPIVTDLERCFMAWDGQERFKQLAREVFYSEHPIADVYLRKTMIAGVARVLRPGCKVDTVLLLIGPQGCRKSTALRTLAGSGGFCDTDLDLMSKDAYLQLAKAWIYELSELEKYYRMAAQSRIRAFISSQEDNFRVPYAKNAITHKRRTLLIGTTNSHTVIQDPEGNRRFWAMECVQGGEIHINIPLLESIRDQLWGEAYYYYQSGEAWHLDPVHDVIRADENFMYTPELLESDVFIEKVAGLESAAKTAGKTEIFFSMKELFTLLGQPVNSQNAGRLAHQFSRHMRAQGFVQVRRGGKGAQLRVWRKSL